ncbi:TPA_asm: hypothetical protein GIM07_01485 [Listeria monocytogenes]|uniref:hypothetical protein n=1 Tax=Listeria monocytogenes TaxID=1639 RepID=UPI0008687DED|nr:hypothetical protein [Listeria monocytogenes]EAG6737998.1 hypothetical protein [Listeria monocytogenes]OEP00542.1 hypothetical protein AJZ92_04345 [Listeria monocytogenes]HAA9732565.1 hypothetical protein [Listeria monocytogenes]
MTKISKMMSTRSDGSQEQFYPETHAQGIVGLTEYVSGQIPAGVASVNGKIGEVKISANDVGAANDVHMHANATTELSGFLSAEDKAKLDGLGETAGISENRANDLIYAAFETQTQIVLEILKEV